eukprot:CAMPEP_0172723468 /NCGR_PEP_ID=MMETSP1074-20121228/83827_1 /TAXON_ID=2916 /ORGANISM="Ceratium fusus, Strain PA161109" /LENGTH=52 /DNA_ID=CAMNT_0013549709 /DNA_START=16 /DNA_END=175 /DNA_ORIENTATION=+
MPPLEPDVFAAHLTDASRPSAKVPEEAAVELTGKAGWRSRMVTASVLGALGN